MTWSDWLNGLKIGNNAPRRKTVRRKKPHGILSRQNRSAALFTEALEDRALLAANISLLAGTLTIAGDNAANNFTVSVTGDVYTITANAGGNLTVTSDDTGTAAGSGTTTVTIGAAPLNVTNLQIGFGTSTDSITFASLADPVTVSGGSGADTITSGNSGATFSLGASLVVNTSGQNVTFSGFETASGGTGADQFSVTAANSVSLVGGAGNDTFTVAAGITLTGSIDGTSGNDTLNLATANASVTLNGSDANGLAAGAGAVTGVSGGFSHVDTLNATGGGIETLTGNNNTTAWDVDAGTLNDGTATLTYTGFDSLVGGTAADTFSLSANATANIAGGAGDDTLSIAAGVALTGSFDGTSGATDSVTVATDATLATLTSGSAGGFSGTITGVTGTFANVDSITTTGATTESIVGPNASNTWDVDANTIVSGGGTLTHTGFDSLFGGTGNDAFTLSANATKSINAGDGNDSLTITGGTLTGSFDGSSGSDTLDLQTAGVTVVLSQSNSNGFGGTATGISSTFLGVNTLTVTAGTGDSLTGRNATSLWDIDAGTVSVGSDTLTYTGFGNTDTLNGGTSNDTFGVSSAVALTLTINGGAGDDTFDIDASFGGSLNGTSGVDTLDLSGVAAANATIGALSANGAAVTAITTVAGGATNIDLITGGASATLTGGTTTPVWTVGATKSFTDGSNSVSYSGFSTLQGGTADDTFNITGPTSYVLNGGTGNDSFVFATGGSTTGTINGEGGAADVLDYSAIATAISVNFTTGAATSVFNGAVAGVSNVENATGSSANDTLVGDANANSLTGGGGADTITGNDGTDTLAGGAGTDTLLQAISGAVTLTPTALGADGITTFEIVTLNGGDGTNETLTVDLAGGSSLSFETNFNGGVGGTDALVLQNGTVTSSVYNFTNATDGSVVLSAVGTTTINYTGLDPITSTLSTTSATLNYSTASETIGLTGGATITATSTAGETVTLTAPTGTLTVNAGDTGDDSVTVSLAAGAGALVVNTGSGNDTVTFTAIAVATTVDGGIGTNTIVGDNAARTYTATGINAGTINTVAPIVTYSNIQNITAGTSGDTFDFTNGSMQGSIDAGTGTDTLIGNTNYNNVFTVTGAGSGTATVLTGTFAGIENITGGAAADSLVLNGGTITGTFTGGLGSDTLTAGNVATAFVVTTLNAGTATGTGGFTGVENLTGNAQADTFTLAGGTLSGTITGGGGSDTFTGNNTATTFSIIAPDSGLAALTAGGTAEVALWTGIENLTGGNGNDLFFFTDDIGDSLSGNIVGGAGTDTVQGANVENAWSITGANAGTVTRLGGTFSGIEGLVGGNVADTFTFTAAASAVSTIDGSNGGSDAIVFAPGVNTTVNVNSLGGGTSTTGTGTFSGIENLTGNNGDDVFNFAAAGSLLGSVNGGTGNDSLTRDSAAAAAINWNFTSAGGGTVTGIGGTFSNMESITGGAGDDTFAFSTGGSLAGSLNGAGGTIDKLDYSALSSDVTVSLAGGSASGVTGTVSNIENITGGSGNDSLTGDANANTINGGSGNDTITGNAGADALDGGFGTDRLQETIAGGSTATLSSTSYVTSVGPTTDSHTGFESASILGSTGSDETLTLAFGTDTQLGSISTIAFAGGTGNDSLNFTGTGAFGSGTFTHTNATDGTITLNSTSINFFGLESGNSGLTIDTVTMNFTTTAEAIAIAQATTQNAITSDQAADFTINNPLTILTLNAGDTGGDTITLNGFGTGFGADLTINAGSGNDTITVNAVPTAGTSVVALNGDAGTDALNVNVGTLGINLTSSNGGTLTGGAATISFSSIESITGSATGTVFTINSPTTAIITGGAGNDTLQGTLIDDVVLTSIGSGMGYSGTEASTGGFSNIDTIIATGGAGAITGTNDAGGTAWSIGATSTSIAGGQTLTFSGFTTLNGGTANDTLTVNFTSANVIPNGLTFNGGAGANDVLNLQNVSTQFASQTFNYTNANDGSVVFTTSGGANTTLTYTGLDPITNTGTPLNVTFNLTTGADTVTLDDQGGGVARLSGGTIELTDFAYPAAGGSITINMGDGADTIDIQDLALAANTSLTVNGGNAGDTVNISPTASVTITGNLSLTAETVADANALLVTGTTTIDAGAAGSITLDTAGNNFTGSVTVTNTGSLTLVDSTALDLGNVTATGNAAVTVGGDLTDSGLLNITGTTTITAGGANVILNNANNFGGAVQIVSAGNATLNDTGAISFSGTASAITTNLTVTAAGAITQGAGGSIVVGGATSLTAGAANNITLTEAGNNFNSLSIVSGKDVSIRDANGINLGTSTVSGNFSLQAAGVVTDSGVLIIAGTTSLTNTAGSTTLDNANNFVGSVTVSAAGFDVTLNDTGSIDFAALTAANLVVTAGGPITDSGTITVTGTASLSATPTADAGNDIILNSAANNFGGALTLVGNDLTIVDVNAVTITTATAGANLTVNAGDAISTTGLIDVSGSLSLTTTAGGITSTGQVLVDGASTLTAVGQAVTMNVATNEFLGVVTITAGSLSIDDDTGLAFGALAIANNADVDAGGLVDFGGAATIGGTLDVDTDANGGTLGSITDSVGPLNVTGNVTLDAGATPGSITLDNPLNDFNGTVDIDSASNVTIDDDDDISFAGIVATGNVDIDAGGAINFDNVTSVGGTLDADTNVNGGAGGAINDGAGAAFAVVGAATFDAGNQDLTLDGGGATNFGSLTFTGDDVTINEDSSTIIASASSATGNFTLTSAAQISINGTTNIGGNVAVTSASAIGTIALNAKMTAVGTVTFTSTHHITIGADIDPTTVSLLAANDVSIAAAVSAQNQITVTAGTDGTGSVELQLGGSLTTTVATGDINISSGNTAAGGDITLTGNVTTLDDLTITSTGTVTQPGGKLVAADLIVNSGTGMGGNFTLGSTTNDFDTITFGLTGAGTASVTEADGVSVSGTSGGGALSVTSTGTVTVGAALTTGAAAGGGIAISGAVTVNGTVTVGAGKITLAGSTAATSDVDINNAVTANGAAITISAPRNVTVGGTVATTTSGNITVTGDSDANGTGGVQVEAAGLIDALGDVTLSGSDVNGTGAIDAVVIDSDGGTVQVEADGNVTIQDGTGAPATSTTVINGLVQRGGAATGSILIQAKDDVTFGADGDVVQNAAAATTTTITADNGAAASLGGVTMNTGTVINGGSGTITITADDTVTLTGLVTNNATAAAVTITVATGGVADAGNTTTDISAASGGVNITATAGVGVGNAIETTANTLTVSTTNTGIEIAETNGLTALSLNAGTGNVTLTVGGAVTDADATDDIIGTTATITSTAGDFGTNANKIDTNVTNLNASSTAAGNIFIDETSGLSSLNISTTGNVTLTAAGSITDTDGAQDISGAAVSVTLSTGSFGASANNIQTTAGDLTVNTSAGNGTIWVTEADGLTELALNAGTGDVNLTVTANGVASADAGFTDIVGTNAVVTLNGAGGAFGAAGNAIGTAVASLSVSTNNGDQFITESNGLTALNLSAGTGDISLTAAGSIIDSDGATDVASDDFTVSAGGAITAATNVNTTTVTTTAAGSVTLTETNAITVTSATVANGSFSLTAGGAITATAITSTTDNDANDISLTTTAGNIQLGNVNAGASGDITVTAAASITDDGDAAATDLTADDVILVASGGSIGSVNFETAIANLEGSATGAVTFDNTLAAGLTFGGASGSLSGFTAGGAVTITDATGTMTFSEALSASGQTVLLTANDMVSNGDGDSTSVDIVAGSLGLTSSNGIGDLIDSVEINAVTLAFVNGANGDVRIRDIAGGLTVGDVGAIVNSTSSGMAQIVALSPLTVEAGHPITATMGLILTATDSSGSGDNLTINADVTGSTVTLNGGDNITQAAGTTINATAGAININADAGTADANGSVVTLNGTLQSTAASTITGGSEADSISLTSTAVTSTTGGLTINGAGGADTVTIDLNGTLNVTVSVNDAGSSSADTDRVVVIGSGTTYNLTNNTPNNGSPQTGGTVVSGAETVAYNQNVENVEVRGTAGADTFDVEPSQTARITIDGLGGSDTLDVNTFGQSFGVAGNTIVVNGGNPAAFLPISFRNIENVTGNGAVLTPGAATQKFDFIDYNDVTNTFSPTAAGFLPVERDRVFSVQYPRTGVGITSTYGWRAGNILDPNTYPNISDVDDGVLAGTTFSDLLRDGHTANGASTFTTQVGNGYYQVTLQVWGVTNFRVRNADTGLELASGRSFVGHGIVSFVTNVTDGSLDLTFDQVFPGNLDSDPDSDFRIDGLELQPAAQSTFLGLSATTASVQPLAADGVTVDAFTIAGTAAPVISVSASLDTNGDGKGDVPLTVTTADIDSVLNLTQVNPAGGFSIRRPTAAGTGIITLQLPDGGFSISTVEYAATATGLLYDFNLNGSATETNYIGVEPTNTTVTSTGYGWTNQPGAYNTSSFPVTTRVDFLRDGAFGSGASTFSTQLTNGTYTVNVTIGSPTGALANVAVKAEGNTAATGVSTPAGQFATRQFLVTVADGQLDLEFSADSATGWSVAGIEVRNAVTGVSFTTALGSVTPDGTTVDVINGNAPNGLVTVTSTLGTITSADQSPLYDGIQVLAAGGTFSFTLQRPVVPGTPTITAAAVNGDGQASSTAVVTYGPLTLQSFDFGTDSSPVAAGYTAVTTGSMFNSTLGYGWFGPSGSPSTYNRGLATGTTTTSLYQDGVFVQNNVFRVAVAAATNYDLRLYYGDQYSPAGGTIAAEGATAVAAPTLAAGTFGNVMVDNASDTNGDGYIDITLTVNSTALALFASGLQVATDTNLPAASPLSAASVGDGAASISAGDLTAIVTAAINRYSDLGLSGAALSRLQSVQFSVGDLGGATIGLSRAGVVVIDDDAAGNGWYVDASPADDAEFSGSGSELRATSGAAAGKYDLLTAVMHELGHELGLDDISPAVDGDDLMTGVIGSGVRRLADVDAIFAANQFWSE